MRERKKGRWCRWTYLACLPLLAAVCLWVMRPSPSPIRASNLEQLCRGMARAEVEQLLGGPPGDYRRRPTIYDSEGIIEPTTQEARDDDLSLSTKDQWRSEELLIVVSFDGEGKFRSAFGLKPVPPGWYRTLQVWLPFLN